MRVRFVKKQKKKHFEQKAEKIYLSFNVASPLMLMIALFYASLVSASSSVF